MYQSSRRALLKRFGESIRATRMGMGLSQEQLAELSGLDRTYVGGVERGERNISLVNMAKLARALNVRLCDLLRGVDE